MSSLIVGIDFGTTNSSVAVLDPATREPEMRKVDVGDQPFIIRTILSKTEEGEWMIGNQTAAALKLRDRSIMSLKTELRKNPDFTVEWDGKKYTITELITIYLRELLRRAGIEDPTRIDRLCLSIPVGFDETRKSIMERAALALGLKPGSVWFIDEPVAVLWDCLRMPGRYVLVFDFGGGTLDLAVLDKHETEEHKTEGAERFSGRVAAKWGMGIGGDDLDDCLIRFFIAKGKEQGNPVCANIDLALFDNPERLEKLRNHPKLTFYYQLKAIAEQTKRKLSKAGSVTLVIPPLLPGVDEGIHEFTVKTEDFLHMTERLRAGMLEGLFALDRQFREATRKTRNDIDAILLSGGSSLVSFVPDILEELFPNARIAWDEEYLQTRITRGNARYALSEEDVRIGDPVGATFGLYSHAGGETVPIISESELVPVVKTKRVAASKANQTKIDLSLMVKPAGTTAFEPFKRNGQPLIWRLNILPHERAQDFSRFTVTYSVDKSHLLRIRAFDHWYDREVGVAEVELKSR